MSHCKSAPCAPPRSVGARRRALLAPLLASVVLVYSPLHPQAQTRLDPVVVIASREPLARDRVTADVVVIDAERIRESSADSLEDLLRREAGVQLSRNGGPGHSAGVFIRGGTASSTLVLVDGVRVGSATLGQVAFEAISLSQIERIEVLRGPGSSLYGADAVGGVVQITTRRGQGAPSFSGRLAVGGLGSREGDAAVSGSTDRIDYALSLSGERSDGVSVLRPGDAFGNYNPDRDGFDRRTGQARVGWTLVPGHRVAVSLIDARLTSYADVAEYAPPDFSPNPDNNYRAKLHTEVASLTYDGSISGLWTTRVRWAQGKDDSIEGDLTLNQYTTRRDQITWQNAFNLESGAQLVTVLEHLNEQGQSAAFDSRKTRDNDSLGLGYSGTLGGHRLSADIRHDRNSVYGGNTTGRLGWAHEVVDGVSLRALAGSTFRAPTFNDLYYQGYGVATIQPERGRSVEAGIDWRAGERSASITAFRNRVSDLIAYEPDTSLCPPDPSYYLGCARNISRALLRGVSINAADRIGGIEWRTTIDFLSTRDEGSGQPLERRARRQGTISADLPSGPWTFGGTLIGVGERPDGGKQLGGYATIDLQARYRLDAHWQLEAKLLNAGDRDYEPARDYRPIGRQGWLAVRYSGAGL
jgi:vitamin B12 transporter